jgi:hypothetical protein
MMVDVDLSEIKVPGDTGEKLRAAIGDARRQRANVQKRAKYLRVKLSGSRERVRIDLSQNMLRLVNQIEKETGITKAGILKALILNGLEGVFDA